MGDLYNIRLLIFADYLATIKYELSHELIDEVELVTVSEKIRIHYKVKFRHWIFEVLPELFDSWHFDEITGAPLHSGSDAKSGTAGAVVDYFNINEDEFCHCFDIDGLQQKRFGGKKLNLDSTGKDFAENICELVKYRRKEAIGK